MKSSKSYGCTHLIEVCHTWVMSRKVITQLIDDIDGKPLEDGQGETVLFALDDTDYEIDLSLQNADKLRGILLDYSAKGRKVAGTRKSRAKSPSGNAAEIRAWAEDQGRDVPDRGRISADVRKAFDAR